MILVSEEYRFLAMFSSTEKTTRIFCRTATSSFAMNSPGQFKHMAAALWHSNLFQPTCTWIDAMENVGFGVEVHMPDHPVYQVRHNCVSTCRETETNCSIRRSRRHEMKSWPVLDGASVLSIYALEHSN